MVLKDEPQNYFQKSRENIMHSVVIFKAVHFIKYII